jgi:hypothetical protein
MLRCYQYAGESKGQGCMYSTDSTSGSFVGSGSLMTYKNSDSLKSIASGYQDSPSKQDINRKFSVLFYGLLQAGKDALVVSLGPV